VTSEASLQRYFKATCKTFGMLWRKIEFTGRRGCPDVFVAYDNKIILVELKSPTKKGKLSALQTRQIKQLRDAGVDVRVIDNREDIDDVIRELRDA
tara:strand:- start:803 stop:1090 length:288 start_codon:yes stop_codon:yes gene_type:complete